MSCKCFDKIVAFKPTDTFDIKLNKSKCKCSSRFNVKENKSRFSICSNSTKLVEKYKVDGYLFDKRSSHKKCDYLFVYHHKKIDTIIFVELKGEDIEKAVRQLENTISIFDGEQFFRRMNKFALIGAIVSTGYPADDATFRKLKKGINDKFRKYKIQIEHKKFHMRYDPKRNKFLGINEK